MVAMRENTEVDRTTYFYCYSARMRKFIDQNGYSWTSRGTSISSGRTYWTFEHSDKLDRLITQYKNGN